jgi:4-amino-4-deoxy-L-arabinose transferase-like glycosyltransferase
MPRSLFIVLALWAAIYLPALGSLEIKGEEGRRILPAVTMLKSGNADHVGAGEIFRSYIVPQVGSEPYLRKPPLVNWLVAASFKVFETRNEWTARLPSALSVLAVALAFVTIAWKSLGSAGALIGAVIWLTNFGMIEKGRLIEIEGLYASHFGLAIICWLSCWHERRSTWLTWTVPFVFLGLGLLAKGPLHLVFFYAIIIAVLWRTGELRQLLSAAHFVGIVIMLGIFAAWAIPYLQMMQGSPVAHVWSRQFSGRLAGEDFRFSSWLLNIPRALAYFLPWLVLIPLTATARFESERKQNLFGALKWGIALPLIIVNLAPGALPRYTMPLLVPAAWLMATTLSHENLRWPDWLGGKRFPAALRFRLITTVAMTTAVAVCVYAIAIVPRLQGRQKVKTIAAQIDAVLPASERLYAVVPDYQPYLFYVRSPLAYVSRVADLPREARYFLVQPENERAAEASEQWSPLRARPILRIKDYRNRRTVLFAVGRS